MDFKERKDLSISNNDSDILSIEITNETKNIILSSVYRPPDSTLKEFKSSLKPSFDNIHRNNKNLYLVGHFNINVLEDENNGKIKNLVNLAFQNSLIPLINKPARVTRTNATTVDHTHTNAFLNKHIETGIIKTEVLDHFLIFLFTDPITSSEIKNERTIFYKRMINITTKKKLRSFW